MNRGCKMYLKEGIRHSTRSLFRRKRGHLSYYFFAIINFFSNIFVAPIAKLADIAIAKNAKYEDRIDVFKAYRSGANFKNFWSMVLATTMKAFIYIAGSIIILVVTALIALLAVALAILTTSNPYVFAIIAAIPGIIILILYWIIAPAVFAPVAYIIDTNDGIRFSEAFLICLDSLKKSGISTYFANIILPALIKVAHLVVSVLLIVPLYIAIINGESLPGNVRPDTTFWQFVCVLAILFVLLQYIILGPVFSLGAKVANLCLFEDIVMDRYNTHKVNKGVFIQEFKQGKIAVETLEDKLVVLFNQTKNEKKKVTKEKAKAKKQTKLEPVKETEKVKQELSETEVFQQLEEELKVEEAVLVNEEIKENNPVVEEVVETPSVEESKVEEEKKLEETLVEQEQTEEVVETPLVENQVEEVAETPLVEEQVEEVVETPLAEEPVVVEKPKKTRKTSTKKSTTEETIEEKVEE